MFGHSLGNAHVELQQESCVKIMYGPFLGSWCSSGRLEDPESEEAKQFVDEQVALTNSVLEKCESRQKLKDRITSLYDYPKYECPCKRGDKYFYLHNTGLQPQRVLYVQVCAVDSSWRARAGVDNLSALAESLFGCCTGGQP